MLNFIRCQDSISKASYNFLHFEKDQFYKTFVGGFSTILIKLVVVYIAVDQALQMTTLFDNVPTMM